MVDVIGNMESMRPELDTLTFLLSAKSMVHAAGSGILATSTCPRRMGDARSGDHRNSDEGAAGLAGENLAGRFEPDSRF